MIHKTALLLAAVSFLIATPALSSASSEAADRYYRLATAPTGETAYPVGVAVAALIKIELESRLGVSMGAISSTGPGENVKLMRDGQAQFAILQGIYGAWAWNGEGQFQPKGMQKNLRSITMLWPSVEHFMVYSDYVITGTIDDLLKLEGEKFSIGKRGSGVEGSTRQILGGLGIDPDAVFDLIYLDEEASRKNLETGALKGMSASARLPAPTVAQAFAALGDKISLLGFSNDQIKRANSLRKLWTPYLIPANTYPGQRNEVRTIAQANFLAVKQDVNEEDVYLITKTIYENLPFLNKIHAATKAMDLKKALDGLPVPLHPGAARYYKEVGIDIPQNLLTEPR